MSTPTFHKHGKDWFPHTPGDPMPCDGEAIIYALRNMNEMWGQPPRSVEIAKRASWEEWNSRPNEIIGWRYADPQPEIAERVPDELALLREEEHIALDKFRLYVRRRPVTNLEERTLNKNAIIAISKLQPFTQP